MPDAQNASSLTLRDEGLELIMGRRLVTREMAGPWAWEGDDTVLWGRLMGMADEFQTVALDAWDSVAYPVAPEDAKDAAEAEYDCRASLGVICLSVQPTLHPLYRLVLMEVGIDA